MNLFKNGISKMFCRILSLTKWASGYARMFISFYQRYANIQSNHQIITTALAYSTFLGICQGTLPRDVQKLKQTKGREFFFSLSIHVFVTHQRLVFNLLADEFVFTQGIACLSCDGVYGSFLHLLFDGTEQHEERLASTLLCFGKEPRD